MSDQRRHCSQLQRPWSADCQPTPSTGNQVSAKSMTLHIQSQASGWLTHIAFGFARLRWRFARMISSNASYRRQAGVYANAFIVRRIYQSGDGIAAPPRNGVRNVQRPTSRYIEAPNHDSVIAEAMHRGEVRNPPARGRLGTWRARPRVHRAANPGPRSRCRKPAVSLAAAYSGDANATFNVCLRVID